MDTDDWRAVISDEFTFDNVRHVAQAIAETALADNSWLLIRPSGTEPVLRIYAESHSDAQVQQILAEGAQLAEQLLGQTQFVQGD